MARGLQLVDTGATHTFLNKKEAKSFGKKAEVKESGVLSK